MKKYLRPSVLLGAGGLVVFAALVVVGIGEGAFSEILLGMLAMAAISASLWNRRLLWANRRETRSQTQQLKKMSATLGSLQTHLRAVQEDLTRVGTPTSAVMVAASRTGDDARAAETAARFDWLARRAIEQERTLAEYLARAESLSRDGQEEVRKLLSEQADAVEAQGSAVTAQHASVERQGRAIAALGRRLARVEGMQSTALRRTGRPDETTRILRHVRSQQGKFGTRKRMLADISALLSMYVDTEAPKPALGEWSLTPRTLERLRREIQELAPQTVVELGSGSSTPLIAHWVRVANPDGTVISVEHDRVYLQKTQGDLAASGTADAVELVHAPLEPTQVDDQIFDWYANVPGDGTIDLLIVDGPPQSTGDRARFPAVPVLAARLQVGSRVVLDDVDRPVEKQILSEWTSRPWAGRRLELVDVIDSAAILQVVAVEGENMRKAEA